MDTGGPPMMTPGLRVRAVSRYPKGEGCEEHVWITWASGLMFWGLGHSTTGVAKVFWILTIKEGRNGHWTLINYMFSLAGPMVWTYISIADIEINYEVIFNFDFSLEVLYLFCFWFYIEDSIQTCCNKQDHFWNISDMLLCTVEIKLHITQHFFLLTYLHLIIYENAEGVELLDTKCFPRFLCICTKGFSITLVYAEHSFKLWRHKSWL